MIMLFSVYCGAFLVADAQGTSQTLNSPNVLSINPVLSQLPPVPSVTGAAAFESINFGSWFSVNYTESSGSFNGTTIAPMEGGENYGVYGMHNSNSQLSEGDVQINFLLDVSGENDSKYGDNSWSIQLNTILLYLINFPLLKEVEALFPL